MYFICFNIKILFIKCYLILYNWKCTWNLIKESQYMLKTHQMGGRDDENTNDQCILDHVQSDIY